MHLHAVTLAAQLYFARIFSSHCPMVVTTFNNERISPQKKKLGSIACKTFCHALGQRVLAISSEMADSIQVEIGVGKNLIRLISYSVDETYFVPPTSEQRSMARTTITNIGSRDRGLLCRTA